MRKYIALLRGVNVGGNNKISMAELKIAFEKCGFTDVKTYINSGNVIFSDNGDDEAGLKNKCEKLIADGFGMNITVTVIPADSLKFALANAPDWWDKDAESKHNAIFVIPSATAEDIIRQAGETKPEYEKADYFGQVIFWSAPIKTFSKTRWANFISDSAYRSVTVRNANTAKKLAALAD